MKRFASTLLAIAILGTGAALAQTTAQHFVHIKIPSVLRIRLTTATGTSAINNGDVMFDYTATGSQGTYETTVAGGGGWLNPVGAAATNETSFGDVKVFSNSAVDWKVTVSAAVTSPAPPSPASPFPLARVRVNPTGTIGFGVSALPSVFTLSTTSQQVATGSKTKGWSSLGFGGGDYQIYVNGTEDPGTTVISVLYTISAP